jgi:hypothetical protein
MGGANVGYRLLALASPLMRFSGLPLVPAPGKRDSPAVVSETLSVAQEAKLLCAQ